METSGRLVLGIDFSTAETDLSASDFDASAGA
jgi:hypothetical protein